MAWSGRGGEAANEEGQVGEIAPPSTSASIALLKKGADFNQLLLFSPAHQLI